MKPGILIQPLVEGDGEVKAVPSLILRVAQELYGCANVDVRRPWRISRGKLLKREALYGYVQLAWNKLVYVAPDATCRMLLLMLDAHDDAPCVLGPQLLEWMKQARNDADVSCVVVNVEYETWFVGAAQSLTDFLDEGALDNLPERPEERRCGKKWISERMKSGRYSETVDQLELTRAMDLNVCRLRCPSFDKLCRELGSRLRQ